MGTAYITVTNRTLLAYIPSMYTAHTHFLVQSLNFYPLYLLLTGLRTFQESS